MKKVYPTLYKKTNNNLVQIWWMEQDNNSYITHSGKLNSEKIVTTEKTICQGKNIGKRNETSPVDQATAEIEAQYKKKLAQGNYKTSVEEIGEDNFFKPMLANKYNDHIPSEDFFQKGKVFSNPKYDGIRCIAKYDGLWSRQGKQIISCPHIFQALKPIFDKNPDMVFDGELYNHDYKNDFNTIISLCRQTKPTQFDLNLSKKIIQFHVYDCFEANNPTYFSNRYQIYLSYLILVSDSTCVKPVEAINVFSQTELDNLYSKYIEQGYEGQIVRIDEKNYENKRTNQLLKRKEWIDEEFEIADIEEGKGNRSGMAGRIIYNLPDGRTFESGIRGNFDFYRTLLEESKHYIGGTGTVRFFNYTPDQKDGKGKVPRFPVTIAVYKGKRDL